MVPPAPAVRPWSSTHLQCTCSVTVQPIEQGPPLSPKMVGSSGTWGVGLQVQPSMGLQQVQPSMARVPRSIAAAAPSSACFSADTVIGRARKPQLSDRPKLPYLEAFILELFRHSSFVPFTIPHR